MITNFEKQTHELTTLEISKTLPILVKVLTARIGKQNAITNKTIVKELTKMDIQTSAPRIRKIIHHIRINELVNNLIASNNGYYRATNFNEFKVYIGSLYQRINSINTVIKQMEYEQKHSTKI